MDPKVDSVLERIGRIILYIAAASIPLAFCRDTMYIFQVKTLILQYSGMALLLILSAQMFFSKESLNIVQKWAYRLIIFFACWQIFKSWNSISPEVSYRQLSRIIWLPVIAISIPWFFRERKTIERLITVICVTALLVNGITWLLFVESWRVGFFGNSPGDSKTLTDLGFTIFGGLVESFFYPGEYAEFLNRKEGQMFPLTYYSFYPGKTDAGTFGSRNFITAYINLTSSLMLYRSATCIHSAIQILKNTKEEKDKKEYLVTFLFICALVMIAVAGLSYYHIIQLINRGSWLGMFAGSLAVFAYLLYKGVHVRFFSKKIIRSFGIGIFIFLTIGVSAVFISYDSDRVLSIFSVKSGTNELRRHIWASYTDAWLNDTEFKGFENKAWRMMTGFGTYTFRVIYPKYRSQRIFKIEFNQHNTETSHPHNEYIGYIGELGFIGFVGYLLMIGIILWRFIKKKNSERGLRDILLFGALLFAIVSQLVHQTVGVSIRYTGVAFQFWLTLGIVLALCWDSSELKIKERHQAPKILGGAAFAGLVLFLVSYGLSYPIQLMRSQHFYEMGQINYGYLRARQQQLKQYHQKFNEGLRKQQTLKQNGQRDPALDEQLPKLAHYLKMLQKAFEESYRKADKFFEGGHMYDKANFESIYIGANMNVQFANQALTEKKYKKAKSLFNKALKRYNQITESAPYFVQARYWQGVCYKGIATSLIMEMGQNMDQKMVAEVKGNFSKAIVHYELYDEQDPIYRDSYYDKFYVYLSIKDYKKALGTLRDLLICFEKGGYFIYDKSGNMRFDPERMLGLYIQYAPKQDAIEALELYSQIVLYKSVLEMIPFVPMTERHITNSFEFLN
jgi:O-antigen ligase